MLHVNWCDVLAVPQLHHFGERLVQIGHIIAEIKIIVIFVNGNLDLHFQGQLMKFFCCQHCHHFYESLVKNGHKIAEIQKFFQIVTLTYIFKVRWYYVCLLTTMSTLWSKLYQNWFKDSRDIRKIAKRYQYNDLDRRCQGHPSNFHLTVQCFPNIW